MTGTKSAQVIDLANLLTSRQFVFETKVRAGINMSLCVIESIVLLTLVNCAD